MERGGMSLTRILLKGDVHVDVREAVPGVLSAIATDWVRMHMNCASPATLEPSTPVYVLPTSVRSVLPAMYRKSDSDNPMSDIQFDDGTTLRVVEDTRQVADLVGVRV
jgi:hypothetical protein